MIEVLSFTSLVPRPETAGLGTRLVFLLLFEQYNHFLLPEVTIGLERCDYSVTEGESQDICGTLDGYLQRPIDVYLSIGSSSKTILIDIIIVSHFHLSLIHTNGKTPVWFPKVSCSTSGDIGHPCIRACCIVCCLPAPAG